VHDNLDDDCLENHEDAPESYLPFCERFVGGNLDVEAVGGGMKVRVEGDGATCRGYQ